MRSHPYQWRALLLMMLAWSVIGLVHNGISFLFPYFSETFALSTAHNGYLTGTLAFFWTLSILVNGPLADRIGQVRLMVPGLVLGAVAFGLSAAVGSVALLYALTALAGFGCGAIVPASLSFLAEQSAPEKRGLFYGAAQSSYTLIGSAIGAVVFTRLAATAVGWRGSYLVIAGLLALGALLLFVCGRGIPRSSETTSGDKQSFRALLHHRNVVLSTVLACLAMMWYFTVAAYTILYLMEARALSAVAAGAIFAGFGGGGFIGEFGAPFVSDRLGRKTTVVLAAVLGGACYAAFVLLPLSSLGQTLALAGASCFMSGAMAICNSVIPSESVPESLVASATSFTPACGECMGGVVAPVVAGMISGAVGTSQVMHLLILLPFLVAGGVLLLRETAPAVLERRRAR